MSTFSIRLSDEERQLATTYAHMHAISLGEAFKRALFERIDDEYDVRIGREAYEEYISAGSPSRPIDDLWEECGL